MLSQPPGGVIAVRVCTRVVSNLRCVAGYYEGTDGEKQANKTRAVNVVQFIADLVESTRRQLCDTGGAMKGMRYSTFTLNVLSPLRVVLQQDESNTSTWGGHRLPRWSGTRGA